MLFSISANTSSINPTNWTLHSWKAYFYFCAGNWTFYLKKCQFFSLVQHASGLQKCILGLLYLHLLSFLSSSCPSFSDSHRHLYQSVPTLRSIGLPQLSLQRESLKVKLTVHPCVQCVYLTPPMFISSSVCPCACACMYSGPLRYVKCWAGRQSVQLFNVWAKGRK